MAEEETKRVVLGADDVLNLNADLLAKWRSMEMYVDTMEKKNSAVEADLVTVRGGEEKLRTQLAEACHRERVLTRRLAHKEHENHDLVAQIGELKSGFAPGASALRAAPLDPAVNLVIARLRAEVVTFKTRYEESQSELSAWKFTADSNTGKRLMAKCRQLYQENEELGRVVSSGRLAKLEGDLALQKRLCEEVKQSQSEIEVHLLAMEEDLEGMQGTVYFLQQELRKAKEAERTEATVQNGGSELKEHAVRRTLSDESDCEESTPVAKKARCGSELSLEYNEEDLNLTNGDIKEESAEL